jgi:hypothetical protein
MLDQNRGVVISEAHYTTLDVKSELLSSLKYKQQNHYDGGQAQTNQERTFYHNEAGKDR